MMVAVAAAVVPLALLHMDLLLQIISGVVLLVPGVQVAIAGPTSTTFTGVGGMNPANNQYQYFAGGGGGGGYDGEGGLGGLGGGGRGEVPGDSSSSIPAERYGQAGTGGGGGGAR